MAFKRPLGATQVEARPLQNPPVVPFKPAAPIKAAETLKGQQVLRTGAAGPVSVIEVTEGETARIEITPSGKLVAPIEWYKDGNLLRESGKVKIVSAPGGAQTLFVNSVATADSGLYKCIAKTAQGPIEANFNVIVKSAKLYKPSAQDARALRQIQHGNAPPPFALKTAGVKIPRPEDGVTSGPTAELSKLWQAERQQANKALFRQQPDLSATPSTQAPQFSSPIKDLANLVEGQTARFECQLSPANDPNLKVIWLFKNKPIQQSSRIIYSLVNGLAVLEIKKIALNDVGTYTCLVVNQLGQVQASANLNMDASRQAADVAGGVIKYGLAISDQKRRKIDARPEVPNFSSEFRNIETYEGKPVRFEAKLTPANDPSLKIEWFFNGQPLQLGSRKKTAFNFGNAILDISQCSTQDTGVYTCRATNALGVAETSGLLSCEGVAVVQPGTQWADQNEWRSDEITVHTPPKFTSPLQNKEVEEAGRCYFEARLIPTNDPHLKIDWFRDGLPLQMANRIQIQHSFGFVSLCISPAYAEDSGTYTCVATNRLGKDQTQAQLSCKSKESLILDSRHQNSLAPIQQLDTYQVHIGPLLEERPEEIQSLLKPRFTKQLSGPGQVNQDDAVHFDCRYQPANDPKLRIEWYKDGQPLGAANKIRHTFDFGRATLDLSYANPEDSGRYSAVVMNELGHDVTECDLKVIGKKTLYLDPQHPEGLPRIQELEAEREKVPEPHVDLCPGPPIIVGQLQDQKLKEGQNLNMALQVKPANDPTMRVDWYLNGRQIVTGSRVITRNEFGHLTFYLSSVIAEDGGEYAVHVYNDKGETGATCRVQVESDKTIKTETQHEESLQRIQALEALEKYPRQGVVDKEAQGPPKFVQQFSQSTLSVEEAQPLHLEAKVEPINDSSMVIEWYHNDQPIPTGHRFKTYQEFGFVSLDIVNVYPEDSGSYTCYARNKDGEAYIQCQLKCEPKSSLILSTDHPTSVKKITELEAPKPQPQEPDIGPKPKPRIIKPTTDMPDLMEGESVHLRCAYEPKDDNKLKVRWYHNGQLLSNGHRYQTGIDFGFASLNILYVYPEDSGIYKCVIENESGQAECQCNLTCQGKASMLLDPNRPESWQKIQELEAPREAAAEIPAGPRAAPKFLSQLQNLDNLIEGQTCHLESQVEPIDDPGLKIEWFANGKPLVAGHRIRPRNEFGYVALDFLSIYPEDTGIYTCKASNESGQAQVQCTLQCQPKSSIILDPNNPESWKKIKEMEGAKPAEPTVVEPEKVQPHFIEQLNGPTDVLKESQTVHLQCQVLPNNDPNLRVEWYFNGQPLSHASRFKFVNEFGFISLDILDVHPDDSGTYTVRVYNEAGEASTSLPLQCKALRSLYLDPQHDESWRKIQEMENRVDIRPPSPEMRFPKPNFTQALQNFDDVPEAEPVRLECRVQPVGDPTLKIQWLINGQPIPQGSRFRPTHDFDVASLDILTLYPEDSGIYSCRAVSEFGDAITSCTVKCTPKQALLLDPQHEESWVRVQELENRPAPEPVAEKLVICAPRFVVPPVDYPNIAEGQPVHFEAQVEPTNDPNLRVEWLRNGLPMGSGHRFRTTHDFSYLALDILYASPDDSGVWSCVLSNALGQAKADARVHVTGKAAILRDVQHPQSWQKIQQIEAPKIAPEPAPEPGSQKPAFVQTLQSLQRLEGQPAHFECRLTPITDPNMRVEWYFNNKPLTYGNRFKPTMDFGFVSLDVAYVHPEDTGVYTCRAYNDAGECFCSAELSVTGKESIISDSQHQSSWQKIQALESGPAKAEPAPEPAKVAPKFLTQLNSCLDLIEGQPAHFEATLEPVGDPSLTVQWFHNGQPVHASSRTSMYNEFGLVALDIHYCFPEDIGKYTCRAINKCGQVETSADLQCKARSSLFLDTLHEKSLDKIRVIEAPKAAPEAAPAAVYQKPAFTEPLSNVDGLPEGEPMRLQCRLIPVNDPNMRIQWYFNDQPLALSNRIAMHKDFGQVILDFKSTFAHDSGVYMCRAVNDQGEAVSTASVSIVPKATLYLDPQHPESYRQVQILEGLDKFPRIEIPDKVFEQPVIKQALQSFDDLKEGDSVRLECHVEPTTDPKLKVEWLFNDKPIKQASRHHYKKDFGSLTLDVSHVIPEDSGVYTCRVTNDHGTATTSAVLKVQGYESILKDTQHPVSWQKIQDLERPVIQEVIEPVLERVKPFIVKPLENFEDVPEGEYVQFEALYQPARDNTVQAEWFHNGKPIMASQLLKTRCELGQATLDVVDVNADHSGVYTLRVRNSEGEAASSASLKVLGRAPVRGEVQHETSWQRIQELEAPKPEAPAAPEKQYGVPSFVQHLNDVAVSEGEPSTFQCTFEPTGDNTLKVTWFLNGQPLVAGSKYVTKSDFGCASLNILHTIGEDSGIFTCKLENKAGQATSSATLKCQPKEALLLDPLNPASAAAVAILEAPKPQAPSRPEKPKSAPAFAGQLSNLGDVPEGSSVHFETFYTPVDDNSLKIRWFHNGQPVEASSRVKVVNDFGFVILDISDADGRDSGEWTCVAKNAAGEAKATGSFKVVAKESIIRAPQQPQSLQKIKMLEQPKEAPAPAAPIAYGAPKFAIQLAALPAFAEGDSVHLEAKLKPLQDPNLIIQWYKDGVPLQYGHRFRPTNEFGFCILDILYLTAEDSGEYTCVVSNAAGHDQTSVAIQCNPKGGLILDTQAPAGKAGAIAELEKNLRRVQEVRVPTIEKQAPVFVVPLQNPPPLQEGGNAYFSARVQPASDNEMQITWYLNGQPISTGSRVKAINDFGYAILEINPVYPEDSGEYVCRAKNSVGEAVTKAALTCEGKKKIIVESQLPSKMSGAKERIAILDAPKAKPAPFPDRKYPAPKFKTRPEDLIGLIEGQVAHFECQLEPAADPNMKIEWFHNGEPIFHSSRIKLINDFGFIIMEISPAEPHDSGTYTCKATNLAGSDSVQVNMQVEGRSGISYDWQQPAKKEQIVALDEYLNRPPEVPVIPEKQFDAPVFVQQLTDLGEFVEADSCHFQAKLEPVGDPSMRIAWFHNGEPIPYSSRIQTDNDFGLCNLYVKHLIPEDSGEYVCVAVNSKGQSQTVGKLLCRSKIEVEPPAFVTQLQPELVDIQEGDDVHLECRVTPLTDPKLQIFWYFNDKPLLNGSRFKMVHEFGYVSMDIKQAIAEDSGRYVCRAVNEKGEATTVCNFKVAPRPAIMFQRQAPVQSQADLERHLKQYTSIPCSLKVEHFYKDALVQQPKFVTPPQNVAVNEGELAKFECLLAPINDPNMKVEWTKNGQPVCVGHRFLPIHDFGYVALVLLYALPEDTGEYVAKAVNKHGTDIAKASLACVSKKGVITDTQLPQGMSVAAISKLEDQLYWTHNIDPEELPKTKQKPVFTIPPRHVQVYENEPARFECAVTGNPRPKVTWYINGRQIAAGSRYKLSYDGMHYLIIPQVRPQDAGDIVCVAKNSEGEAQTLANLDVFTADDFRSLKLRSAYQISPEELAIREEQWRVDTLGSLGEAFQKAPRAHLPTLMKLETARGPIPSMETEELVGKFQKKRDEVYDKIFVAEHKRLPGAPFVLQPVQLKPSEVIKRDLPKEELAKVDLRIAPKVEKVEISKPETPWSKESALKRSGAAGTEESPRYRMKPAVPKEVEVPAKGQVSLKIAKPKPADEQEQFEHVKIAEKASKIQIPTQKPAQPREVIVPAADQVSLKAAFKPKEGTVAPLTTLEEVQLKSAVLPMKIEERKDEKLFVKTPAPAQKSVKQPPTFTKQLAPVKVESGKPVRLHVEFSGDQPIQVSWFRDGQPLTSSFEYQIKSTGNESVVEIGKVKADHVGNYLVRIQNVAGQSESVANLIVGQKVDVTAQPAFQQVLNDLKGTQGNPVRFDIRISGKPSSVLWFKDGKQIIPDNRCLVLVDKDLYSILITEALPQDSGVYECIARNNKGEARCKGTLQIPLSKPTGFAIKKGVSAQNAPKLLDPLKALLIAEGSPATFTIKIGGTPAPTVKWFRNNVELKPNNVISFSSPAENTFTLHIKQAFKEDEGEYKIEATNAAGKATCTAPLKLTPKQAAPKSGSNQPPKVTKPLSDQSVKMGDRVILTVDFTGSPQPTATWLFNGRPPTGDLAISGSGSSTSLTVAKLDQRHIGKYTCRLNNQLGQAETSSTLKLAPAVPAKR